METIQQILYVIWAISVLVGIVWVIILLMRIDAGQNMIEKHQFQLLDSYEKWIIQLRKTARPANRKGHVVLKIDKDRNQLADTTQTK